MTRGHYHNHLEEATGEPMERVERMSTEEKLAAHRQDVFAFYAALSDAVFASHSGDAGFAPRLLGLEVDVVLTGSFWLSELHQLEELAQRFDRHALLETEGAASRLKFFPRVFG